MPRLKMLKITLSAQEYDALIDLIHGNIVTALIDKAGGSDSETAALAESRYQELKTLLHGISSNTAKTSAGES